MLIPILISVIIILGVSVGYIYYLAPRLNPENRAKTFVDQNMISEAIIEYKKLLEKNPGDFRIHFRLAELYFGKGQMDEGVLHYEEVLRINRFNHEIDKIKILKKLSSAYMKRGELPKTFQSCYDILKMHPDDMEALYQVSFISLGQEYFDMAQKHFDRLVQNGEKSFEVLFGAGMASLQNQKTAEAIQYFREALSQQPHSDVANLAMAFALQKKRDFKTAINYLKMIVENSEDVNAVFIARRLLGVLFIQARQPGSAVKVFEELFEMTKKNEMDSEIPLVLYDLGFACIKAEKTEMAYEYWNQLYGIERGYDNIKNLITMLRKEMDADPLKKDTAEESVVDHVDEWIKNSFPENYMWNICGLKNHEKIDMKNIVVTTRVSSSKADGSDRDNQPAPEDIDSLDKLIKLDAENFRIIANRIVSKLGYNVDEILGTYRESDGVDFLAHSLADRKKALIWVRRWKGTTVGEIPLRNFAQSINDLKAKEGLFITTAGLTGSAETALSQLSKITVVYPDQVAELLSGLV